MNKTDGNQVSSGVEQLIAQLRDEGVHKGQEDAAKIVGDAQAQAAQILQQARNQAESIVDDAYQESERMRTAIREELQVAFRNTVVELKEMLARAFANDLRRLVSDAMVDERFLEEMILELASQTRSENSLEREKRLRVLMPSALAGGAPAAGKDDAVQQFVAALAGKLLREGVTFATRDDPTQGIKVRLVDKEMEVDMTDKMVANLLLEFLQPRFRAILEGLVR
jgi:V/A-type H+-transporting ATPase subunit E